MCCQLGVKRQKKGFKEMYREEKKNVKRCIYQRKKKVNEEFGRK